MTPVEEPVEPASGSESGAAPRISVCLATYNGARYIGEQLDSILAELGPTDEVVVVDDASTDDTVLLLRGRDDPRVHVVELPVNRGYVRSFEESLRHARGEFLLLCDQDDVWVPGRAQVMADALEHAQVVATNLATLDGPDRIGGPYGQGDWHLRVSDSRRHARNIVGILVGNRPYYGCAMGVRREALDVILPLPEFLDESHDLWIALYGNLARSIVHLDLRSVRRRFHGENASSDRPRDRLQIARSRFLLIRSLRELRRRVRRPSPIAG